MSYEKMTAADMIGLTACPFCGPEKCAPEIRVEAEEWEIARVGCRGCNALGPYVDLGNFADIEDAKYEAAVLWNERIS